LSSEHSQHLRRLPSVERVLNASAVVELCRRPGRTVVADWVREVLDDLRTGGVHEMSDPAALLEWVVAKLIEKSQRDQSHRLRKVINGTGVVIHTNLGRAPLATAAIEALHAAAAATNIEIDLLTGYRGRRGGDVESLCRQVAGAEAALVVNNCAAATLLTLQTLAAGKRVVISRGQLIEIGGSFRLPEVFAQADVTLHEVGTTNRTRLKDYETAIGPETAALLRVHPSNYRVTGFCESVAIDELATLGKSRGLPVIDDVGSGCLYDLRRFGLPEEPIVADSLRAGADLVLFSGDKLLGGPQCGIIVGRAEYVERLRANPLARALRTDKLTCAALQATLEIHRAGRAFEEIPVLRQLTLSADEIRERAEKLVRRLSDISGQSDMFSVQSVESAPGGGSLAGGTLPSWAVAVSSHEPDRIAERLRMGTPAVVGRVQEGMNLIDLRTVMREDEDALCRRLVDCVQRVAANLP
jgi:L-seryl-tRNA(Ser) seleniumtransferase